MNGDTLQMQMLKLRYLVALQLIPQHLVDHIASSTDEHIYLNDQAVVLIFLLKPLFVLKVKVVVTQRFYALAYICVLTALLSHHVCSPAECVDSSVSVVF